ncbi:MAG: TonB-dependent receptor [Microscillaceae bacterium]|nr:TonB-dependent receptor [Microscillaceae bacterium]
MKHNLSKIMLGLLFIFISVAFVKAQTTVSGTITDAKTSEGLIGVNVVIKGKVIGTVTDKDGNFNLTTNTPPPFTLSISSVGFLGQELEITGNQSGISIQLEEQNILGQELVISASRVEESVLESPVTIEKMDVLAIQQSPGASFYDNIKNLKGVDVSTQSLTFTSVTTRGFNSNGNVRINQLIDGIDNSAPGLNFPAGNVVGISELDLESVELLPGASSALYGSGGINGALLMRSKSPFEYQGLSAYVKLGANHFDSPVATQDPQFYYDAGFRYAKAFNDKFAFKVNVSWMDAEDWQANDFRDRGSLDNPNFFNPDRNTNPNPGYNGVNIYGDEVATSIGSVADQLVAGGLLPAAARPLVPNTVVSRTGYLDSELVDYDVKSLKTNLALHYRVSENVELIGQFNYGFGTTVYTANSRNSLSNFSLTQAKIEARGSNFFLRAWTTQERSGDSFDAVNLGVNLNRVWKSDSQWFGEYVGAFVQARSQGASESQSHVAARQFADVGRLLPGTAEFDRQADIVRKRPISESGALFTDKSNLYTFEGMYNFNKVINFMELMVGGNYRIYELKSEGTLFDDANEPNGTITVNEFGFFVQATKALFGDRLKLLASTRYDKNENFEGRFTPRGAIVYSAGANKEHNIRFSVQTGFRFPTTQNQFIRLPIPGLATLLGGLPRFTDSFSQNPGFTPSTLAAFGAGLGATTSDPNVIAAAQAQVLQLVQAGQIPNDPNVIASTVQQFVFAAGVQANVGLLTPIEIKEFKPERVLTYELGYKTLIGNKFYIDIYGYYSIFKDFLLGNAAVRQSQTPIDLNNPTSVATLTGINEILFPTSVEDVTFAFPINSDGNIKSYGFGIGMEYSLPKGFKLGGNFYFDDLDTVDDIIDAQIQFNTPKLRYNLSLSNREVVKNLGFNITWRWQDSYIWESSFGVGNIPAYHTVDFQASYKLKSLKSTLKLGGQNLFNNYYNTSFGNPQLGGLYYISWTFDQLLN